MTMQEQQAALAQLRVDSFASTNAMKNAQDKIPALASALKLCVTVPKACVAEFNQVKALIAHEQRETAAIAKLYTTALAQNDAWNAYVRSKSQASVAAMNAATASHNAAGQSFGATVDEHNRLAAAYQTAQTACNKGA